jgi:putative phosphonate catabolism associated alcohol dehydrogenase
MTATAGPPYDNSTTHPTGHPAGHPVERPSGRTDPPAPLPVRYARWDGAGEPFSVVDAVVAPGSLKTGQVLVAVDLAAVCGSDVHSVLGHRPSPHPGVLGHEQIGRVVAVGPGEAPRRQDGAPVAVGDRVVWSVTVSCGRCERCRAGLGQKCLRLRKYGHEALTEDWPLSGGFATHCVVQPGTTIVAVEEALPDEVAVSASCATATVAAALAAVGELSGARLLVTGAGMLGVTATAMATEAGARVTVSDPDPARRALAARFAAATVCAPDDIPRYLNDADAAVELSGSAAAVAACLDAVGVGGRVVLAGSVSTSPPVPLDPERVVRKLMTVTGVHNYRPQDLAAAVAFLTRTAGTYPFGELTGEQFPLDRIDEAVAAAARGAAPRQTVRP